MSFIEQSPAIADRFSASTYRSWMRLSLPWENHCHDALSAAAFSASLPWLWKLHLTGGRLVAEVPQEAFEAVEAALRSSIDTPQWTWPDSISDAESRAELRQSLGDWAGSASGDGVALELAADRGSYVRAGARLVSGGVRLIVDVTPLPKATLHREAAATLACRVCDGLVMARAYIADEWIRYDVSVPGTPSAALLERALGALSTGCRIAGRECYAALGDPVIARTFLKSNRSPLAACAAGE